VDNDNNTAVGSPHQTNSNRLYSEASETFKNFSNSLYGFLQAQSIYRLSLVYQTFNFIFFVSNSFKIAILLKNLDLASNIILVAKTLIRK